MNQDLRDQIELFKKFSIVESKNKKDINLDAFKILSHGQYVLIAKVLWDNGIKSEHQYVDWLKSKKETNKIPQSISVGVQNSIRDFEINFINPEKIPNIFKLTN